MAIGIVTADGIGHRGTYGERDLTGGTPVTPDMHFIVGSTTKSMSSLLVATLVGDGALAWDQPVRDVWPDFRVPSDALTRGPRVRDLFGMASGVGEPDSTVLHFGDPTAGELLRPLVNLPIDDSPLDGGYAMAGGFAAGHPLRLFRDDNGVPWLDIPDLERVRWTVGPADWPGPGSEPSATPTANA